MAGKLYTVDEANALLPQLTPILLQIQADKSDIDSARAKLAAMMPELSRNGHGARATRLETEITQLVARIQAAVTEIRDRGIEIKDLDQGLIDFPAWREDRVVFLCWRLGEDRIRYWHELDAGFAGRQPL